MCSHIVSVLKIKIKQACPLCVHMKFLFFELTLGHLRDHLTDVPPQPNSPPDYVFHANQPQRK